MEFKSYIMDSSAINRSLTRISHEIVERNPGENSLCIIGIKSRGTALARILSDKVSALGVEVETLFLDVTNYRDDLAQNIAGTAKSAEPEIQNCNYG